MSKGKLLNEGVLSAFKMYPRDVLKELVDEVIAIKKDPSITTKEFTEWSGVSEHLMRAYNSAPRRNT